MEHQASGNFLSNLLVLGKLPKTVRQWAGIARDNYPTIQLSNALTTNALSDEWNDLLD